MTSNEIAAIERQAQEMRAEEFRRLFGMLVSRVGRGARALTQAAVSLGNLLSENLRPLFSWNPRGFRDDFTSPHRPC